MSKNQIWYGYLDAKNKSTPVVLDPKLDTGNPHTVYLFNFHKRAILEYRRDIVEPKLRDFKGKESEVLKELKSAFETAKKGFKPRGSSHLLPETVASKTSKKAPIEEEKLALADGDEADDFMDDVWEEED